MELRKQKKKKESIYLIHMMKKDLRIKIYIEKEIN